MASVPYTIVYDASSAAKAATDIDRLAAALTRLDQIADKVRPKIQSLGVGSTRGLTSTTKAADALGVSLAAVQAKAAGASTAVQTVGASSAGAAPGIKAAGSSLASFATRMVALQAGRMAFTAIMNESKSLEEYWQRLAKEASDFRGSLRELASLKGKSGPGNDVAADVLDLALASRMTAAKAKSFSESYENLGPTVRDKGNYQPSKGTAAQLEAAIVAEAAKTAGRLGIDEKAAGTAIGTAGMFHKFSTVEDAMEQFGGAARGLSEGSVNYSQGFKYLNVAAAKLVDPEAAKADGSSPGKVGSFAEAGVLLGALSLGTGGSAAVASTRMLQLGRALNPKADNEEAVNALKDAGVFGKALPDQVLGLSEYFQKKGIKNPTAWMQQHNIGTISPAQKEAVEAMTKIADVARERIDRQRKSAVTNATGRATVSANAGFAAADKSSSAAGVDAIKDVMDKVEGIEGAEAFEQAKAAAEERMRLFDPSFHSPLRGIHEIIGTPAAMVFSGVGGKGLRQESDPKFGALARLRAEGKRVGVNVDRVSPDLEASSYQTRARAFSKASDAVRAAGGDPIGLGQLSTEAQRRVNATRGPAAGAGGGGGAAPGPVGPQASLDPALTDLNRRQLGVLERIDRKLAPGGGPGGGFSPRPGLDGGDYSPERIG